MVPPVKLKQLGYVLLLPVFFILHSYNDLFGFIPPGTLLKFGLYIYLFAGIVFGITWLFTKSVLAASFITFCCLLLELFWGAWLDFFKSITHQGLLSKYSVLLPVTVLLLIGLCWYLTKRPLLQYKWASYLSLVVLILIGIDTINFFLHYRLLQQDKNQIYPARPICNSYVSCNQPDSVKPDIYFIIFDEYTNNNTLRQVWGYDNNDITDWLDAKGFYTPDSSKANYSFTTYSLSSVFNMNYLHKRTGTGDDVPDYFLKAVQSMSSNETFCLLQKEHYKIQFISPFTNTFQNLDILRNFDHFPEKRLYNHTLTGRIEADIMWHFTRSNKKPFLSSGNMAHENSYLRNHKDNQLIINSIKSTTDSVGSTPKFVYGHLMITHTPHLYDSAGNVLPGDIIWDSRFAVKTYINQVKQANRVMKELVDHILTHNKRNTVIIIMGDHGFRKLPPEQSKYSFPNFSAFYFPDQKYDPMLNKITAVNTFRYIFNHYFCQNLSLLKDSSILVKY